MKLALATTFLIACGGSSNECADYMRITAGTFTRIGPKLKWTLEVIAIPPELTFNRASVPDAVAEYLWAVDVDPDQDGQHDWQVAVAHFKSGAEVVSGDLLSQTQQSLLQVDGALSTVVANADVTLTGNAFTFIIDESEGPDLPTVVNPAQSSWHTFERFGATTDDQCEDRFEP